MARVCAFCSADAVEKGEEHIWDDWIDRAQPKKSLYRARKRYAIDSPTIEYDTASIGEQLPVVCVQCDSGWMRKPALNPRRDRQRGSESLPSGSRKERIVRKSMVRDNSLHERERSKKGGVLGGVPIQHKEQMQICKGVHD